MIKNKYNIGEEVFCVSWLGKEAEITLHKIIGVRFINDEVFYMTESWRDGRIPEKFLGKTFKEVYKYYKENA